MNIITKIKKIFVKKPQRILAAGFLFIILIGAILLSLPIATKDFVWTPFIDSLFISTSAVCVTGLVMVNTAKHWSTFGHLVIITLIQIGGLGFMTATTLVAMILGKKITLKSRLIIREQMNTDYLSGMVKLIRYVLLSTFIIEGIGAILLSFQFIPKFGIKGIWYSIFHSISAFCNAGFDILGDTSLEAYSNNLMFMLTISSLIVLGGIGFNVYMDITLRKFKFKNFSVHTKLVLVSTLILLVSGTVLFLLFEGQNISTIGEKSLTNKVSGAFFQSVTTRTAGFASFNQKAMLESSAIMSILLMFIGGSPAGCAGGVKTTTFSLLILTTLAEIKGDTDINIFKKRISINALRKAIAIVVIALLWISTTVLLLTIFENHSFIDLLFETVSGLSTVGLTRDITSSLKNISKIIITITMYLGRVGPMTLVLAFSNKKSKKKYRETLGNIIVG